MRYILFLVAFGLTASLSFAQDNATTKKAKDDIQKLHNDWNEARAKKDQDGLEKIFAKEYVFIHGNGNIDDRATAIDDQLNTDSIQPLSVPNDDDITVYGETAVAKRLIHNPQGSSYNTIVYVKRSGRWQIALHQTTVLQPERKYKVLAANELQKYTGKYEIAGQFAVVSKENDTLKVRINRVPKRTLLATSDNLFYDKVGTEYKFVKNVTGVVTQLILTLDNGQETTWKKLQKPVN